MVGVRITGYTGVEHVSYTLRKNLELGESDSLKNSVMKIRALE